MKQKLFAAPLETRTMEKIVKELLLTCGLLLAACVPFPRSGGGQVVPMETVFDLDEHRPYLEPGMNNIKGQAFLVQRGGGVVTCAGNAVALLPATKFFDEYLYLVRRGLTPQTKWKAGATRHGYCDAQGNFSFTNLPDGKWYIFTEVRWQVPLGGSVRSRK
jgi:hypothetical protein